MLEELRRVPLFAGMSDPALQLLVERVRVITTPAGTPIVQEGDMGNRMFIISSGFVRVCKNFGQPEEVELAALTEGEFFGEMCILETMPRAATVQALTDTTLYSWSALAFLHLYEAMPGEYSMLLLNIARDLSRRLRILDEIFAARH